MGITKVFLKRIVGPKISRAKPRPPLCLPWPHPASTATATLVLEGDVEDGRKMMLAFYIVCFICIFFRIYLQFLLIFIFVSLSFLYYFPSLFILPPHLSFEKTRLLPLQVIIFRFRPQKESEKIGPTPLCLDRSFRGCFETVRRRSQETAGFPDRQCGENNEVHYVLWRRFLWAVLFGYFLSRFM